MFEPREESKALHHRGLWPRPVGVVELEKLKVAIATQNSFPTDSDNAFQRTHEEWISMEELLAESHVFVIKSKVTDTQEVYRIFVILQSNLLIFSVYKAHTEELDDLEFEYESN